MIVKDVNYRSKEDLEKELEELRYQLDEAHETIEAIRTGQIDALVVEGNNGHQLYTLKSADFTYRVFIEKMAEGAITLSPEGTILYSNPQFATMVHTPLAGMIGSSFIDFIITENRLLFHELFKRAWTEDCKGEVMMIGGDRQVPVQLSLAILGLEEIASLSIIVTDLTEQKAAQKQLKINNEQLADINLALEASNHDLQQFASVASHDLQEPLRKIQVFSKLMKDKQVDLTPDLTTYLEKIIDSSGRMKTLIIDILNYSRLSANFSHNECIDLNDLTRELREDFELIVQEKNARISIDDLPCVEVNKGQVRQVFQNIISNALKFSKPGVAPIITVTAKKLREKSFESPEQQDGHYCLITISDNGIGFDEKYVGNIFALFERLHPKDRYEGTGIGLAIAKKIIDKHNGLITASSSEGNGAEFRIILPIFQTQL
jgi:PAS domain S-box-containing protein